MEKILVLNNDYTPINVTTLSRGFKLVFKGKAEVVHFDEARPIISSVKVYRRPTTIRLLRYIYLPYKKVPLSRYNIYRRDGHRCVYCGTHKDLTLDHVKPKSKGGKNSWTNLVTCCSPCNLQKGDLTVEEAGMEMSQKPYRPNYLEFIERVSGSLKEEWKPYLFIG
jgi:5-methylcytosine-specific restriction endonuclease McrA